MELLSHGVGIFLLYRRGTRDEFNSDWSLSITSSLGTLFSFPSFSLSELRGPTLLVSLLVAVISRLTLSLFLSLSPAAVAAAAAAAAAGAAAAAASPFPCLSLSLSVSLYLYLRSGVPLAPQHRSNVYSFLFVSRLSSDFVFVFCFFFCFLSFSTIDDPLSAPLFAPLPVSTAVLSRFACSK